MVFGAASRRRFLTTTARAAATWKPMISEPAVVKWLIAGSLPNARPGDDNDPIHGLRGFDLFWRHSNRSATVA